MYELLDDDLDYTELEPYSVFTSFIPQPGFPLVNSPDPRVVSLPLLPEFILIGDLEEYHTYRFTVYVETSAGKSNISEPVVQEMPGSGMFAR